MPVGFTVHAHLFRVHVIAWLPHSLVSRCDKAFSVRSKFASLRLTFALLGGVWTPPPPTHLWFFADSKKTAAHSAAGFSPTLSPIFLATFVKVSILGHARSGHQVRSSDHTLQKLYNRAPATVFEGKLWNCQNMIRSSVPTKCISWIFDIGDLRSGHFRDLPINGQKLNSMFYASSWAYMNGIASGKVFIDTPSEIFSRWPLLRSWRSLEVTNSFFANNLRTKWDRDVGLLSLRLSPQGASNDV